MERVSSLFGGAGPARIEVKFADADSRSTVAQKTPDGRPTGEPPQYLFTAADNICGTVSGARVQFAGAHAVHHCALTRRLR